jgi:predicted neuraminidase
MKPKSRFVIAIGVFAAFLGLSSCASTKPAPVPVATQPAAAMAMPRTITTLPSDVMTQSPAIVLSEFIFEKAPFPSCHASTIAQTKDGLVAAWFGGLHERAPDVGIWVSRNMDGKWSPLVEVANGIQPSGPRLPCWNPALFQSEGGPLLLFYKIGPSPALWWGMMMTSDDQGVTWSKPHRLPDEVIGPAKDKPIQLSDGSILAPSGVENDGDRLYFDRSTDLGVTWTKIGPLNEGHVVKLEQPTLLDHGGGLLQFLCRSHSGHIYQGWSTDNGQTWSAPTATELPNPNSGIDAVQLRDGRSLLVYNNSATEKNRRPLNVAISPDGKSWKMVLVIEDTNGPQLSYPAVIQTRDGLVHITYTWKRLRIRHVVLDPNKL